MRGEPPRLTENDTRPLRLGPLCSATFRNTPMYPKGLISELKSRRGVRTTPPTRVIYPANSATDISMSVGGSSGAGQGFAYLWRNEPCDFAGLVVGPNRNRDERIVDDDHRVLRMTGDLCDGPSSDGHGLVDYADRRDAGPFQFDGVPQTAGTATASTTEPGDGHGRTAGESAPVGLIRGDRHAAFHDLDNAEDVVGCAEFIE